MQIISLERIKSILPKVDLISEIEAGFAAYSNGLVVVPPVGELSFQSPPGDVHIKYGYIKGDPEKVKKVYDTWKFSRDIKSLSPNWLLIDIQA